jgi:hypothetical protein
MNCTQLASDIVRCHAFVVTVMNFWGHNVVFIEQRTNKESGRPFAARRIAGKL